MEHEELAGWLRLQLTPGVGDISARRLLTAFGLPEQIFCASASALEQVVSSRQSAALQREPENLPALLKTTEQWLQAAPEQRRVITLGDAAYPQALLQTEDPPLLLYATGAPEFWHDNAHAFAFCASRALAIVGSRTPSTQGVTTARQIAQELAQSGLTIVSGLALGIDGAAHEGALDGAPQGQLATIAVVGTGVDSVYPRQHLDLARRIAQRGILLSEYPLGTPALANNFPKRNRIIAALARGTLVVEAALRSGSLITARLAAEQGKDVFAIPGSIHSAQSRGCHALIKQGARLVESAQDVLEEWQVDGHTQHTAENTTKSIAEPALPTAHNNTMTPEIAPDNDLLNTLGFAPMGLDALQARTGLDTATLQARLMELELLGQISRLPGGLFQRMALA